jgi:non-heme Fe2+,alpha-ketoglutarate-dependent halogenase
MTISDAHPDMNRQLKFFPITNSNPKKLTPDQIEHFNKWGYIFPLDVFNQDETEANRAYFENLMQKASKAGHNNYSINGWHLHCKGIHKLLHEPRILDYVEDLIGPNIISTMTHYFSKKPHDEKQVSWHQDASYWPLTPSKVITVWLAIDDVDEHNGPMTVIPGSHIHGQIPFENSSREENNVLGQSVHDPENWGESKVPFTLRSGQISIHTDLLLHGSEANQSNRRRCGLTLRYMPPDVRTTNPDGALCYICRGTDAEGYWKNWPIPSDEYIPNQ